MNTVKSLLLLSISFIATGSAFADSFVPSATGLDKRCAGKIVQAVTQKCNADSANDSAREHACFASQSELRGTDGSHANFDLSFTVTDADDYWYEVRVLDKATCRFVFRAEK